MKVTACVIVKNEEKNIITWLTGVEKLADEIIVVDTGSEDNTEALVKQSRASLYHFPWINDFAAAKNFALDKATGDWIVFLDADETFSTTSIPKIKECLQQLHGKHAVVGIMCRLINIDIQDNNRYIGSTVQLRIFRNKSYLRYTGKIHEALTIPKQKTVELMDDIEIYHTGYSSGIIKKKLQRNLELLRNKIAKQGGDPTVRDYRYLMDCYYGLADYSKALANGKKAMEHKDVVKDALPHIHIIIISCHIFGKMGFSATKQAFECALQDLPDMPDITLMYGLYLHDQKHYLSAQDKLEYGLKLYSKPQEISVDTVADNSKRFLPGAHWVLGKYAHWQGNLGKAIKLYVEGLQIYRYHINLLSAFIDCADQINTSEADIVEILHGIYEFPQDYGFILKAISPWKHRKLYQYYAVKAGQEKNVKTYQAAQCYNVAAMLAHERLDWLYRCGIAAALAENISTEDTLSALLGDADFELWKDMAEELPASSCKKKDRQASVLRIKRELSCEETYKNVTTNI